MSHLLRRRVCIWSGTSAPASLDAQAHEGVMCPRNGKCVFNNIHTGDSTCTGREEARARGYQGRVCGQHWCVSSSRLRMWCAESVPAELFYDRGHHHEFLSLSQELAAPGEMRQAQTFDFLFKNVEKQFESYQGINVKLRCVTSLLVYTPFTNAEYDLHAVGTSLRFLSPEE